MPHLIIKMPDLMMQTMCSLKSQGAKKSMSDSPGHVLPSPGQVPWLVRLSIGQVTDIILINFSYSLGKLTLSVILGEQSIAVVILGHIVVTRRTDLLAIQLVPSGGDLSD